ncbi:MAG: hypothetical protein IJS53_01535 [Clostridia bacterium]|nr:hypothetical protein [Clostridia bacterium]
MYPIPDHLKPYLVPIGDENSELRVTGALRCKCGSAMFTPYVNDAGTIAAAKCRKCGAKILLLHAGRHGWDGFVAKDYLYDLPTKMHAVETCPACQAPTPLAVKLTITSFGKEDFIRDSELSDENGKPLREEDWVNAFSSFRMDLVCPECSAVAEAVVDIETA